MHVLDTPDVVVYRFLRCSPRNLGSELKLMGPGGGEGTTYEIETYVCA